MNRLDLQETKSGWDYQLYVLGGDVFTSGHVDTNKFQSALEDLEEAVDKIETITYGNFEPGNIIFLQERNGNVESIIK